MGREYGVFVLLFAICAVLLYSQYEVFLSANKREDGTDGSIYFI